MILAFGAFIGFTGLFVLLWYRFAQAAIPQDDGGNFTVTTATKLVGTFLSTEEDQAIWSAAFARSIDPRLLAAIRKAENGGPGREFGILSIPAPTYTAQVTIAANTIANNIVRYESERGYSASVVGRYTEEFILYLSGKYAPIGAANDPTGLNQNWFNNVNNFYRSIDYA